MFTWYSPVYHIDDKTVALTKELRAQKPCHFVGIQPKKKLETPTFDVDDQSDLNGETLPNISNSSPKRSDFNDLPSSAFKPCSSNEDVKNKVHLSDDQNQCGDEKQQFSDDSSVNSENEDFYQIYHNISKKQFEETKSSVQLDNSQEQQQFSPKDVASASNHESSTENQNSSENDGPNDVKTPSHPVGLDVPQFKKYDNPKRFKFVQETQEVIKYVNSMDPNLIYSSTPYGHKLGKRLVVLCTENLERYRKGLELDYTDDYGAGHTVSCFRIWYYDPDTKEFRFLPYVGYTHEGNMLTETDPEKIEVDISKLNVDNAIVMKITRKYFNESSSTISKKITEFLKAPDSFNLEGRCFLEYMYGDENEFGHARHKNAKFVSIFLFHSFMQLITVIAPANKQKSTFKTPLLRKDQSGSKYVKKLQIFKIYSILI